MPNFIYSLSAIIVSAIASLVLFLRIKKNGLLSTRFFFWHYALGFAIISLTFLPIFFINLGAFTITYNLLLTLYAIRFFAILSSYLLFYRGTMLLHTKDRFTTTIIPIFVIPIFAILTASSLFFQKVPTIFLFTAFSWGFLIPLSGYLAALFLYFFIKGAPLDGMKKQLYALILSLAWFIILLSIVFTWFEAVNYDPAFWMLKVATFNRYYLAQAIAHLLILIGALGYGKRLVHSETTEQEKKST